MNGLWCQSNMGANRNTALSQKLDRIGHDAAAFDFNHVRARSHNSGSILKSLLGLNLIAAEGHVGNDERFTGAARNTTGMINHVIQRDG